MNVNFHSRTARNSENISNLVHFQMGVKGKSKPFISKKEGVRFRIVRENDQNTLAPIDDFYSTNPQEASTADMAMRFFEEEETSKFGFSDYEKHLRTIGGGGNSVFIPARNSLEPVDRSNPPNADDDVNPDLLKDLIASGKVVGDMVSTRIKDFHGILEETVDFELVDELENDFMELAMQSGDEDNQQFEEDYYEEEVKEDFAFENKSRFTGLSKHSDFGEARTVAEEVFHAQFAKVLEEYSDEDIGGLCSDSEADGDLKEDQAAYEHILDEYLAEQRLLVEKAGAGVEEEDVEGNEFVTKTKAAFKVMIDGYEEETYDKDVDVYDVEERRISRKNREEDCMSMLSSATVQSSTIFHTIPRPRRVRSKRREVQDSSDEENDTEEEEASVQTVREKNETREEKKARKASVKEHRRIRRQTKKAVKAVFKEEKHNLSKQLIQQSIRNPSRVAL